MTANMNTAGRFADDCPECGEYECVCRPPDSSKVSGHNVAGFESPPAGNGGSSEASPAGDAVEEQPTITTQPGAGVAPSPSSVPARDSEEGLRPAVDARGFADSRESGKGARRASSEAPPSASDSRGVHVPEGAGRPAAPGEGLPRASSAALTPEYPCFGWCNDKNCDCVAEGASYTCKRGSYRLADGSLLFVESTHPRGRIRVTRTVAT